MNIRTKIVVVALGFSVVAALAPAATSRPSSSDKALRTRFFAHRGDFEKLVAMANEDSHLTRIASDFTWLDDDAAWPRNNVGISEKRWNDYKQLFREVGDPLGILKSDKPARIEFPIFTVGSVPSGAAKGLVYSQSPLRPVLESLDTKPPEKYWNGTDRSHVLVYKAIGDHWYIFYEEG
ncbi:MAG TPA: hypothetical protein VMD97_12170 [Candidatus Aquilonibacter sp.]|nr:hypothetical protein [Candidatus Aquilonibacter sp.]